MNREYKVYMQLPKPKLLGICCLSVNEKGDALLFRGEAIIAKLERAKMDFAAAVGIMISGMEPRGCDKSGRTNYKFQKWWLNYTPTGETP